MMDFLDDYPTVIERQNDEVLNASETPEIRHEFEICFIYEVHKLAALCIAWVGWFITLLGMVICHYRRRRDMQDGSDDLRGYHIIKQKVFEGALSWVGYE